MTGFHHTAVLAMADKIITAVTSGRIRHFFLIGGCDGFRPGRNYYTEFAQMVPKDCVMLTLACGKYRFNKLDFGDIDGIPRLLDMGQCNNAYSAIKVVNALAEAFNCPVNDLPLSKEIEAEKLYQKFSGDFPAIKDIFVFLANEEQRHKQLIEKKIYELTK